MSAESLHKDPRFLLACELFDAEEFFACHDELEEMWSETLGEERQFLQGMIHAAVALFHFTEGNLGGARKMYDSTQGYLKPYHPTYAGLNVETFVEEFRTCFAELLRAGSAYPEGLEVDRRLIPKLGRCGLNPGTASER